MRSLIVLARLLDYPTLALQQAADEMRAVIEAESHLPWVRRQSLMQWIERIAESDLLDLQADYVALFDRGRATSLLLFEHVHGESRDRGQAMVDLLAQYRAAGFELDARELPDYLPLFLEYLSTRPEEVIAQQLGDIAHILARLTARLEEREADQALATATLLALIGAEDEITEHQKQVREEKRDDTPAALDAVWEEEAVRFSASSDQDCAVRSAAGQRRARQRQNEKERAEPVRIIDPATSVGRESHSH
ncbi:MULTISPECIES: nitrate reductase molybdenum cofactor assembly chaperone [Kushneria]|uniref:Respiratory nitrate reductase chaperone NarJ n=2 Tax=Kushneria TaxID=504090 RepID=A0A420WU73_9GAMM|nr:MULTISPECIES: nitrate reductase molybdenum cofactor assembly chaperone [Kushneria]OHV07596.1 nitrate reductase molybdenum cofactor assembly chaperone [Kushneria phosphatilytica]QEL10082.1 nitrate reductase molybdenum cofactor assembly chaperone [Kushneria phosphatilytica]RKQ96988.1 respiratory nitrate reductase chaperone NarJ [Kushneria sinocarnis]